MRKAEQFNIGWQFVKEDVGAVCAASAPAETVTLPHTWNALDGQDGGNDYYRGKCWYIKTFMQPDMCETDQVWLDFGGVAMVAEVYLNGQKLAQHAGGYSTFRVDLTGALHAENTLCISVDNSYTREVYPQKADFTFYGGIYRDVRLLVLPQSHFAMEPYGTVGMKVTPVIEGTAADIRVEMQVTGNAEGVRLALTGDGKEYCAESAVEAGQATAIIHVENVHLWHGIDDPFLYTVKAELIANGETVDVIETKTGCRTFAFDPNTGFILNGKTYPLCGVSRHQDRRGAGNALTAALHRQDMKMIQEIGANTIRLAHYQHDQQFYDLCDETGMIVWAEIPYITEHMPEGRDNTISQMAELVTQNYNHPSIICWGLSNEVTVTGGVTESLVENHRALNDLCHELDATRPTTMAHVFILDINDPLVMLPDICSYNLYYGWYVGEVEDNDVWFDDFHTKFPQRIIGLSEYGADALISYQTATPQKGDASEQYQALYHEHMLKMWKERPYIWAMHVWNMFDFAADGRNDAGEPGVNHKGLVTFDRKVKKDAFYIYKAYLSRVPFVHLCGSRYIDRAEAITEVKVYSNLTDITLRVDGKDFATQSGDKVFSFNVPISGEHWIEAVGADGIARDEISIRKVAKANPAYSQQLEGVVNWFDREDMQAREDYFSIKDSVADLKANPETAALLQEITERMVSAFGDVAKGVKMPADVQRKMEQMPFESQLKAAGKAVTADMVIELNRKLNTIKK